MAEQFSASWPIAYNLKSLPANRTRHKRLTTGEVFISRLCIRVMIYVMLYVQNMGRYITNITPGRPFVAHCDTIYGNELKQIELEICLGIGGEN